MAADTRAQRIAFARSTVRAEVLSMCRDPVAAVAAERAAGAVLDRAFDCFAAEEWCSFVEPEAIRNGVRAAFDMLRGHAVSHAVDGPCSTACSGDQTCVYGAFAAAAAAFHELRPIGDLATAYTLAATAAAVEMKRVTEMTFAASERLRRRRRAS